MRQTGDGGIAISVALAEGAGAIADETGSRNPEVAGVEVPAPDAVQQSSGADCDMVG